MRLFKAIMMMAICLVMVGFLTIAIAGPPDLLPLKEDNNCIAYLSCDSWSCVSLAMKCQQEIFDDEFFTPL